MELNPVPLTTAETLPATQKIKYDGDEPTDFSRRYFIGKEIIIDTAKIILPKLHEYYILPPIPEDSYWQLEFWNLQKVMPDLLMKFPEGEKTMVVLKLSYLPDESVLKLEAKRKFSDFPFYEISGMRYQVDFLMEDTKDVLLSTKITLYADMYVEMFENVKNHITMRFNAVYGDVTAEIIDDKKKGGFVFRRGLDEFLDEGFNDYLCR